MAIDTLKTKAQNASESSESHIIITHIYITYNMFINKKKYKYKVIYMY